MLDKAVDISELGQRNLWVIYGRSGSGKTELISTFPKPLLYVQIGDDGSNTISDKEGIKALQIKTTKDLKDLLNELKSDTTYKSVAIDTFSLLVNEWQDANATSKGKRMTLQMYGDMKSDTEELIRLTHILSKDKIIALTCHEVSDTFEGMEDEIAPDIRPSVSKGARTYLEGMSNYGIHTTVMTKVDDKGNTIIRHCAHVGANPYYWVKTQKSSSIKLPSLLVNPTYDKITKLLKGGTKE